MRISHASIRDVPADKTFLLTVDLEPESGGSSGDTKSADTNAPAPPASTNK